MRTGHVTCDVVHDDAGTTATTCVFEECEDQRLADRADLLTTLTAIDGRRHAAAGSTSPRQFAEPLPPLETACFDYLLND